MAVVPRSSAKINPVYDGAPRFEPIDGTPLKYAVNSPTPVIQVGENSYYAIENGVWFSAPAPNGPWVVTDSVPAVVYTIPPSSPLYNVVNARVYDSNADSVVFGYTPGYYGSYIAPTETVVYGTGWGYSPWLGSCWYGRPWTYGWGAGFGWWGTGWGFGFGFGSGWPWWGPVGWHPGWGVAGIHSHWGWPGWHTGWNGWGAHPTPHSGMNAHNMNVYNHWGNHVAAGTASRPGGGQFNTAGRPGSSGFNAGGRPGGGQFNSVVTNHPGSFANSGVRTVTPAFSGTARPGMSAAASSPRVGTSVGGFANSGNVFRPASGAGFANPGMSLRSAPTNFGNPGAAFRSAPSAGFSGVHPGAGMQSSGGFRGGFGGGMPSGGFHGGGMGGFHGGGGGGGHGGGTSRGGDPIGVQVTAHQVLGHDPSFAATGHIEAIGHFASPFDIRGFGTDWHLV